MKRTVETRYFRTPSGGDLEVDLGIDGRPLRMRYKRETHQSWYTVGPTAEIWLHLLDLYDSMVGPREVEP